MHYMHKNESIAWVKKHKKYLCLTGSNVSILNEHRVFTIHPRNDPADTIFPKNQIKSSKYTLWNFIPKNLFEQFRRVANFYFLVSAIIAMTIESPVSPLTTFLPLFFVILVTAGKQGYEDFLRHRSDDRVNGSLVTVIRNKCMQVIKCDQIVVGDLVKVSRDDDVPCDLILLFSSEPNSSCYVTTSNLDGETNLKTLQVPKIFYDKSVEDVVSVEALVTCQHPQPNLYEFHGKIEIKFSENELTSGFLTIENMLLRGSRLKDTEFILGTAVYTGSDTKLSLNSKSTPNKFSTVERSINTYLIFFIFILFLEIFFSTAIKEYNESTQSWSSYLGYDSQMNFFRLIVDVLSFTVLYNYIIPISLYVTVELQKFLGSFFFRWDIDMYDERNDQPALANTSDLNEDLGQIEYLFTDKTGTLTENLMVFRRCSINGNIYIEKDCNGKIYQLPANGDEREAIKIINWPPEVWHFMIALSLCHSVHVAPPIVMESVVARRTAFRESFRQRSITRVNSSLLMDPNLPEYQAASADEKALVEASARCGVVLTNYIGDQIEIKVGDQMMFFTRLEVLEFTSERKKMSVVVQDTAGDLWLYSKGADSEMFPLLKDGKINETELHVADFSQRGLRTLIVAYKKLTTQEYDEFVRLAERARQVIGPDRSTDVAKVYYSLESGLTLLGATGIEDRLQEGVQETLESLRAANIKIWVLTGDKAETAENIAFSCGHFKSGTEVLRLMRQSIVQNCFITLTSFERKMKLEPYKQYGLIIDGTSIAIAYKSFPELLRIVTMNCDAVVCCRMSPLQKSEIVQLIKNAKKRPLTAAIGDGGNDVSMIQEAHVGIGILGKEGRQAAMNADFAFSKFMHLRKALLVHGHWYYVRISILTQYFFYKNIVFITPQLLFGIFSGFSAQPLYASIFLMLFNVIFTSLPVLTFGLVAQDYSAKTLLNFPQYYMLNKKNRLLSGYQMISWMIVALWQTCVIYFGTYAYWNMNPVNLWDSSEASFECFSTCIFHLVTLVTNLELLIRNPFWTYPFISSIVFSEIIFFIITFIFSSLDVRISKQMFGVFYQLFCSPSFWLLTIIIVPACLLPDTLISIYERYRPMKLNYQEAREESLNDTYSEWSEPSVEERRFTLTPWRGNFSFNHK
ncbi:probable phospholipid-transporting ATPase IF isoform X2 [Chelonus insularis]|uniref:probable phospholipid-transporting ATPase IF isoform X2 n=1 Tax=Chelonus insularis TaxID=460826 RepID=UPI001589A7B2|nr:probable phospholipid-transporting ATPase IF isoform X2 [Chelonus insularis]